MTVASTTEDRVRKLLASVPELLRADRPPSTALPRVIDLAKELFGARHGGAALIEEDGTVGPTSLSGVPEQAGPSKGGVPKLRGSFSRLVQAEGVVLVPDVREHPDLTDFPGQARSLLGVHLCFRRRSLGVLYVADRVDGSPFTAQDVELATALGEALGAAIANANLLRDALRDRRWMRAANAMTRELFADDVDEPLRLISDRARELAEADVVAMMIVEGDHMHIRYARGAGTETSLGGRTFLVEGTWTGRVMGTGQPQVLPNLAVTEKAGLSAASGVDLGPAMLLPLHGASQVLGVLFLARQQGGRRFTEADLETASSFADHAAVSLELAGAREVAEKLRLLEERNRIARDLHDHVIQRLYATGMSLQQVLPHVDDKSRNRIEVAVTTLDDTIRPIRNTILTLRTPDGSGSTLGTLVTTIAQEAAPLLGFSPMVALEAPADEVAGPLAQDLAACIREGLSNVVRHARAEAVQIRAFVADGELNLSLQDDGIGIRSTRRSGLANLQTRVHEHGGTLEMGTPPEGGTLLVWKVPLAQRV